MFRRLAKRTPFVVPDDTGYHGPTVTASERNVRVPVGGRHQAAPDPPAQGLVPARPAMVQVVTFSYDMNSSQDDRFQTGDPEHQNRAWVPRGRMTPDGYRQNIGRAQATAYGSMVAMNYPA